MSLFFQPPNAWVGDLIPFYEDGVFYAYYLHDPRKRPGAYAEETTWHLATTRDLVHFTDHGEAIPRGEAGKPNRDIYTGSVILGPDGRYYAYYTAFNPDYKVDGKSVQSVMRAVGSDPLHLATDESFCMQADGEQYEAFDWRDPFVFWNDEERCYWMLLAARIKGAGAHRGGCIGLCTSDDLLHWRYASPVYSPGMYITMECPEMFRMGNWWYLVFSTFSDRFVTHYRMARSPAGPWRIPPGDDAFDSRANYAIKTASDGQRRYAFGWIPSRLGGTDSGPWEWGGTMALVHEVVQRPKDGTLFERPAAGAKEYFSAWQTATGWTPYKTVLNADNSFEAESMGAALCPVPENTFSVELDLEVEGCQEFGFSLHTDTGMEEGYFLRISPRLGLMAWDRWPRAEKGAYQWQINGDVACMQETARPIPSGSSCRLRVLRENNLCVVYYNDEVALSARLCDHSGGYMGPYGVGGRVRIKGCTIGTN